MIHYSLNVLPSFLPSFVLPTEAFSVAHVRHVGRVDARLDVPQVVGDLAPCISDGILLRIRIRQFRRRL